jgi:hypothetical protein
VALSVELQVNNGRLMAEIDATAAAIGAGGRHQPATDAVASSGDACCARRESLGGVRRTQGARRLAPWLGTLAAFGVALFPKCPICWAAYLSAFGVAGLGGIPYSPWLQPLLAAAVLANLASMWMRGRASGRMSPFWLAGAGALLIAAAKAGVASPGVALTGVAFTLAGSALSVALGGRRGVRVESGERSWRRPAAAVAGS